MSLHSVFLVPFLLAVLACPAATRAAGESGWGSVKGRFIIEGDAPKPILRIKQGDPAVKDTAVCAAQNAYRNDLVIDPKTKGIRHIFIYLREVGDVHPELKEAKLPELKQDQKGCRFVPHTMVVRTGQKVRIINSDPIGHSANITTFKNPPYGKVIPSNVDKVGLVKSFKLSESLPMPVVCDIHPHMKGHWLILDHPYAAITNAKGEFEIKNLPAGDHTFRVWHEKVGWIVRSWSVIVRDGEVTNLGTYAVDPQEFED